VDLADRKIPEYEPNLVANVLKHLVEDGMGEARMWTLVVAILNECDRCVYRTAHMILRTNWQDEHGGHGSFLGSVRMTS
jgi:uncharacterized protein YcbX